MLEWSIKSFQNFSDLHSELHQSSNFKHPLPLLDRDFFDPVAQYFYPEQTSLLCGRDNDRIMFLCPVEEKRLGVWCSAYASQLPIVPLYASAKEIDAEWLRHAVSQLGLLCLKLDFLHYDSQYLPRVNGLDRGIGKVSEYGTTISIPRGCAYEEYWAARPKKLRDNMKRYAKKASKEGHTVEVKINRSPADIDVALATYANMETQGWKGRSGTAISNGNVQYRFYADVLKKFAARDSACIIELQFDGVAVSSRIAVESPETIVFLKTTYLEEFSAFSPGRLLLNEALQYYLSDGIDRTVEFYTSANKDMLQWGAEHRSIEHLSIYRSPFVGRVLNTIERLRS